ncbi:Zn(2)-C6 fungal-type DNA-binding domain protein [Niveomyces insectorum RCEF 264]|uniref:Zn(2)-C6 fungal-type DNA-binding domain protein n=1 Tax=Niveomyces insectorum RCEF 264 TaxID=1081102 RepID=A0A167LWR3_9HYPO|nr:Zn(2)-C6 fungal-type DNA-binding domain protein [Niveomyces insectorum RCEF 264]
MTGSTGGAPRPARIASCEPCRLSKLACDHGRPVCSRCAKKGVPDQCVYRRDPFKRSRHHRLGATAPRAQARAGSRQAWGANLSPGSDPEPPALQLTMYPNPGFQGSSSLNTILDTVERGTSYDANIDPALVPGDGEQASAEDDAGGEEASIQNTMLVMSGTAMVEEGAQVLELLTTLLTHGILQHLFEEWMGKGLEVHVGSLLVRPFLDSIADVMAPVQQAAGYQAGLLVLSRRLFNAAKISTEINGTVSLPEFAEQYTGQNLRWETVGLILALAGNAVSKLRAPHPVYKTEQERHTLGRNLLHSSNKCASFSESLDILNDVQIIFLYESFLLHSAYFGHQSFRAWGRLNTAINALFGRGIHQRLDNDGRLPFFLVELRKHIFALLYGSDISFSVFLGRPPRISKRHCVIHVPLDVTPDTYGLTAEALQEKLQELDERGWNTLGEIRTHAVIRWSMTTSKIREEALEAILGPEVPDRDQLIRNLRIKIEEAWNELPPFLAVPAREVWMTRRPGQETDALYLIRLYYLQTIFLIEWTASIHGTGDFDSLFAVASDLLAWVNEALTMRECLNRLGLNTLAWRVSAFGLPAAGALAKCMLAGSHQPPQRRQSSSTFIKAVRDLSVLIAHMDYLYDSSDGNYKLFRRAKGILIRVVESTLRKHTDAAGADDISPATLPIISPPSNCDAFDQWEFRPELWIGLPGPNSTEVNHLDFMSDFTQFID